VSRPYLFRFLPLLIAAVLSVSAVTALPGSASASDVKPAVADQTTPLQQGDSDDGPDIVELTLLTLAASGIAALIGLIGYLVRRGVGYDPHRPGPDDEPHH
jgi:hypothetical protein